jgi:hypothetical protein
LREALPSRGRRAGSDPVSAWARLSIQTTERYLGCKQQLRVAVNDRMGIEQDASQSSQ